MKHLRETHRTATSIGIALVGCAVLAGCSNTSGANAIGRSTTTLITPRGTRVTTRITPLGVRVTTSVDRQYCFVSVVVKSTSTDTKSPHELSAVFYRGSKTPPMAVIAMDRWATLVVYGATAGSPTVTWTYRGTTIDRTVMRGHFATLAAPDAKFPSDYFETADFPLGELTLSEGGRVEHSLELDPSAVRSPRSLAKGSSCLGP